MGAIKSKSLKKCLAAAGKKEDTTQNVELAVCDESENQKWDLIAENYAVHKASGKCMDVQALKVGDAYEKWDQIKACCPSEFSLLCQCCKDKFNFCCPHASAHRQHWPRKNNNRYFDPAWCIGMILESIVAPSQCCRRPISSNGVPQRLPLVL